MKTLLVNPRFNNLINGLGELLAFKLLYFQYTKEVFIDTKKSILRRVSGMIQSRLL